MEHMMLKLFYKNKDDIPKGKEDLFTEVGGQWVLTEVQGIKTQSDIDRIHDSLKKERTDHDSTKEKLKAWGDLKPDETLVSLDRMKELEAAGADKLDEDKINEIVEGRLAQKTGPLERDIAKLTEERNTAVSERDGLQSTISTRNMHEVIRQEAVKAKVHPSAISDIELIASNVMEFDENNNLVTKANSGVTPGVDVATYLKEKQETNPHWWPASVGGGAGGGGGGTGRSDNPWKRDSWNVTKQGQIFKNEGEDAAKAAAAAAGTTLYGGLPDKK